MKIHFIGAGGIGISGLAGYASRLGHEVSGSDIRETALTRKLKSEGIALNIPHGKEAITDQELVVKSAAIKDSNPEVIEARKKGIRILHRREYLKELFHDKKVYATCGAHGKSTTTAILSAIMEECSTIIGAESKQIGSNYRYIENSSCIVFEADESDGSFLNSNPHCAIVTNCEPEHMEYYNHDINLFHNSYRQFLDMAKKRVINAEDSYLGTLEMEDTIRLYPSRDIKIVDYILLNDEPYTRFSLKDLGEFDVWGFGEHIAIDASLAILAAVDAMPCSLIKERLKNYRGIKKRFDILQKESAVVIDDYAHHPTEITVTLNSLKKYAELKGIENITAIWQPHKYSRTIENLEAFKSCFEGSNRLVILPVYSAGEEERSIDFEESFKRYNLTLADRIIRDEQRILIQRDGDILDTLDKGLIVGFGAGDITYQLRGAS